MSGRVGTFFDIPQPLYRHIAAFGEARSDPYCSANPFVRQISWARLHRIYQYVKAANLRQSCLDFGGGTGVLLPTLARTFREVECIDADATLARRVVDELHLLNVTVREENLLSPADRQYQVVVAADVLEQFVDCEDAVESIASRLAPGGRVYTSLPNETPLTAAWRELLGRETPASRYHSGMEVQAAMRAAGFRRLRHTCLPLRGALPLYLISEWERS